MSAGSGIIHQEMPKGGPTGAMYGFQLWANLPAAEKMMEPRYQEAAPGDMVSGPVMPGDESALVW
jgi:redox-sensitive bicupin YhaK (pirin superfamily)